MKKRFLGVLLLPSVISLLSASCALATSPEKDANLVGKLVPAFNTSDLTGGKVSSADFAGAGKAVLVNFWGLRCSACLDEMPHLKVLFERYRSSVEILGVNVDGIDAATLAAQMQKKKIEVPYRVIPDPAFQMVDGFKMTAAPLTVLIDGKGVVRYRHENYEPGDEKKIEDAVRTLLGVK